MGSPDIHTEQPEHRLVTELGEWYSHRRGRISRDELLDHILWMIHHEKPNIFDWRKMRYDIMCHVIAARSQFTEDRLATHTSYPLPDPANPPPTFVQWALWEDISDALDDAGSEIRTEEQLEQNLRSGPSHFLHKVIDGGPEQLTESVSHQAWRQYCPLILREALMFYEKHPENDKYRSLSRSIPYLALLSSPITWNLVKRGTAHVEEYTQELYRKISRNAEFPEWGTRARESALEAIDSASHLLTQDRFRNEQLRSALEKLEHFLEDGYLKAVKEFLLQSHEWCKQYEHPGMVVNIQRELLRLLSAEDTDPRFVEEFLREHPDVRLDAPEKRAPGVLRCLIKDTGALLRRCVSRLLP